MNWEHDFPMLVSPINKSLGFEIRSVEYLHWWTFIGGYMEIGECQFSTVVGIRKKLRRGVALDKWEREFYEANRSKVDFKSNLTKEERDWLDGIIGTSQQQY